LGLLAYPQLPSWEPLPWCTAQLWEASAMGRERRGHPTVLSGFLIRLQPCLFLPGSISVSMNPKLITQPAVDNDEAAACCCPGSVRSPGQTSGNRRHDEAFQGHVDTREGTSDNTTTNVVSTLSPGQVCTSWAPLLRLGQTAFLSSPQNPLCS
jgi:hypothetical protein